MKRLLFLLGGGVIVLCLAVGGFCYWINIPPQIKIPTPVMPEPNGYDYFVRASAAYVRDSKGVDKTTDLHFMPGKRYPIAAKETWLKQNAKALHFLRKGLRYPALHPPTQPPYDPTPSEIQFPELARTLVVESHVRAAHDDWRGAVDSTLDGLKFGYDIQRGAAFTTSNIIGNGVQEISLGVLSQLLPNLDATLSRQTAVRMERLYKGRFPYFKTMEVEKHKEQADLLVLMNKDELPQILEGVLNVLDPHISRWQKAKLFLTSKRTLLNDYTKKMDAYIAEGRLPYIKMQPVSASRNVFTRVWTSFDKNPRWNWARVQTNSSLIMTMLALRAFRLEKGHYPARLKKLMPEYLREIPIDPFDGIAPLHYQLQGNKYLLWSIGPDGVDNHGTPITNLNERGRARHLFLSPDSKGDVVAGINMP